MSRPNTADLANVTRAPRPLVEDVSEREPEPGDFLCIELPIRGVKYEAGPRYRFVGCTVDGAQGSFLGAIHVVYIRTGHP